MLLAIDCGNTNTVFSIWDGTQFIANWRIASSHKRTADQYFVWLNTLMTLDGIAGDAIEGHQRVEPDKILVGCAFMGRGNPPVGDELGAIPNREHCIGISAVNRE